MLEGMSLSRKLNKDDCEKWKINKNINPVTGRKIASNTITYKQIEKECEKLSIEKLKEKSPYKFKQTKLLRELTKQDCDEWKINKQKKPKNPKNPITNYRVLPTSDIYKELDYKCENLYDNLKEKKEDVKPIKKPIINKKILERDLNLDDCLYWVNNNKMKNPLTKTKIKENTSRYNEIENQCKPILDDYNKQKQLNNKKKSISPKISISKKIDIDNNDDIDNDNDTNNDILHYPDLDDKHFREKLSQLYEYSLYKVPEFPIIKSLNDFNKISNELCGDFEKTMYQYFISNYISIRSPYKSLLVYHGLGTGKTCSAITLAESFLASHKMYEEPCIWVIMPLALKNAFKEQIFNLNLPEIAKQCTGDMYLKMANIYNDTNKDKSLLKIKKLIKSRYRLFTYEAFATFIEQYNKPIEDKVIIVDEAHNIRSISSNENVEKRVYSSLINVLENGKNNKLILMSATPMYNKPEDIFDLLYLLLINDKRQHLLEQPFPSFFDDNNIVNKKAIKLIELLSSNYISYLRGKNPFTFALKLTPKYMDNIKLLTHEFNKDSNNKTIPKIYKNWLANMEDDIVISNIGEYQHKYILKNENRDDNNVFNNLQPMNIVYNDTVGEKGFNNIFTRIDNKKNTLVVKYNKSYENALYPDLEHLGKYSGKFMNICNIIKNTNGVIVIYSGYIWSGVVPLAICLEHMGFNREGSDNILQKANVISDPPKYGFAKSPKYCILSSENSEVMGSSSIDNLMKIINNPNNIDGSMIKVILITPVASEGLSFYNIREMHLIEPWFHFNKVAQIIGRGIRNCRHQNLPIEERNVTVFMHASYQNNEKESADIHAFRIASQKAIQTKYIDNIIKDNAIDCSLFKNINYFPKSLFELGKVEINTSQGIKIKHEYGDDDKYEPKCYEKSKKNKLAFRREIYKHFIPALQLRLKRLILKELQNGNRYLSFDYIIQSLNFDKDIIYDMINSSIYPKILINNYHIIPHNNGLHIVSIDNEEITKLRITYKGIQKEIPKKISNIKLTNIANKSIEQATINLYLTLNSTTFEELVKTFIEASELNDVDIFISDCLYRQGALIANSELKSIKTTTKKYIGYINIFNNKFEPIIYINGKYRDLIEREISELLSKRKKYNKPDDMSQEKVAWGMLVPILDKKTNIYTNVFKILTPGISTGVKTGIVCSSLQKSAQDKIIEDMGLQSKYNTKIENCNYIANELLKINRLTMYPEYKP